MTGTALPGQQAEVRFETVSDDQEKLFSWDGAEGFPKQLDKGRRIG